MTKQPDLSPFENALRLANPGISQMEARTITYWSLATHYDFDPKPILAFFEQLDCGKTWLARMLAGNDTPSIDDPIIRTPLCKNPLWMKGNTYATIRDELDYCYKHSHVAVFDQYDEGLDNTTEGLLAKRFLKSNSSVLINVGQGGSIYQKEKYNLNGWTSYGSRKEFSSAALMSRCIIIKPKTVDMKKNKSQLTDPGSVQDILDYLGDRPTTAGGLQGRAAQIYLPLAAIARILGDDDWLEYVAGQYSFTAAELNIRKGYEDKEAILKALEICRAHSTRLHTNWIKISSVKRTVNVEFDKHLKPDQVATTLHRQGYKISKIDGFDVVWMGKKEKRPLTKEDFELDVGLFGE